MICLSGHFWPGINGFLGVLYPKAVYVSDHLNCALCLFGLFGPDRNVYLRVQYTNAMSVSDHWTCMICLSGIFRPFRYVLFAVSDTPLFHATRRSRNHLHLFVYPARHPHPASQCRQLWHHNSEPTRQQIKRSQVTSTIPTAASAGAATRAPIFGAASSLPPSYPSFR